MITKDILLYENGDGGQLDTSNNDIQLTELLYQQVYICLFGGNVEAVTKGNELESELRNDWWGNPLFFKDKKNKQFNSVTEKTLNETVLNPAGRQTIKRAVESDLQCLSGIAKTEVTIKLPSSSKVEILVRLKQPQNEQDVTLQIIWSNARKELITFKTI
ncbi:MAG: hypothetical protein V4547_16375 [Bacteroidota bacterium]